MAIIRWRPLHDIDELFSEKFITGYESDLACDMYKDGNNIIVKMNIPGIKAEDIDIKIDKHHIHIRGQRTEKFEVDKKNYYHKEICSGSFERTVSLPHLVDEKQTKAEINNGILTITMPQIKKEELEHQKITVVQK